MGIIDFLKKIFTNNKKNPRLIVNRLTKTYGTDAQFEVALYDDKTPLKDETLYITINGRSYQRKTDENGIARLNINLNVGEYPCYVDFYETEEYNSTNAYTTVTVKSNTRMEGTNINKTASQTAVYQCAVYDKDNNRLTNTTVDITINGVTYNKPLESDGLARLNIKLGKGNYTIQAQFNGTTLYNSSNVTNTVTVSDDPKPTPTPTPTPTKLYPYLTSQGGGKLGQKTGYSCGPHSLMQGIYRLTGVELSEATLMSVCGTTSSGTSHDGLATGLAWFNRKYGYNLKMTWKNFSEVGFDGLQRAYENGAVFCHLLYRNQWGHYEVPLTSSTDPMKILNSLGNQCGNGYCGYIENRNRATQQSYINGISQKSVCILTR